MICRETQTKRRLSAIRNDENLAVAQTHLAFLKLHNRFVDEGMNFDDARKATIQHYQSMVINDFLPRIIAPEIYSRVFESDEDSVEMNDIDCMPIEFAVAAYRFGHSMVRNQYDWNRVFRAGGEITQATLEDLFRFSEVSGDFRGLNTLPSNWVVDWRRLYDFGLGDDGPEVNMARKIDTKLALKLERLEEFGAAGDLANLSIRNLLRSKQMQLPTGQQVAAAIGAEDISDQIEISVDPELNQKTPLWFYILRESMVQQDGNRLGEVGSWIVAKTFKQLILDSEFSVLKDADFVPHPNASAGDGAVTMPSLLTFVDDINPLGGV